MLPRLVRVCPRTPKHRNWLSNTGLNLSNLRAIGNFDFEISKLHRLHHLHRRGERAPSSTKRKPPDWQDFVGIITLLFINSTISFIEENNAGNAVVALMACLAPKAKVLCDGKWSGEYAVVLVPGDVVSVKLGDIIPADARLLEGDPLKIDQSALSGESFPVTKSPRDGFI